MGLKGNAVRIGNSSRCCKFPDRDNGRSARQALGAWRRLFCDAPPVTLSTYLHCRTLPLLRSVKYVQLLLPLAPKGPGRRICFGISQKTCRAFMRIRSCGEWVRISDECVVVLLMPPESLPVRTIDPLRSSAGRLAHLNLLFSLVRNPYPTLHRVTNSALAKFITVE